MRSSAAELYFSATVLEAWPGLFAGFPKSGVPSEMLGINEPKFGLDYGWEFIRVISGPPLKYSLSLEQPEPPLERSRVFTKNQSAPD